MVNEAKHDNKYLLNQLIRLGDMMGDGLHLEPDGKWISKEYKKTLKALGMLPPQKRKNNNKAINDRMALRIKEVKCTKCDNGKLKQTRSGSKRAICISCGAKWQLLK